MHKVYSTDYLRDNLSSAVVSTGGAEGEEIRRLCPQDPEGLAEVQV